MSATGLIHEIVTTPPIKFRGCWPKAMALVLALRYADADGRLFPVDMRELGQDLGFKPTEVENAWNALKNAGAIIDDGLRLVCP